MLKKTQIAAIDTEAMATSNYELEEPAQYLLDQVNSHLVAIDSDFIVKTMREHYTALGLISPKTGTWIHPKVARVGMAHYIVHRWCFLVRYAVCKYL